MKVKFHPRRKPIRKLWLRPVEPTEVQKAIQSIMGSKVAYWGDEVITPMVLIREGYKPVNDEDLSGQWYLPNGKAVSYDGVVYHLASGG